MHCHICDRTLSEAEIQVSPDGKGYEPCSVCMEVILDAAYSDGFVNSDDLDEIETLEESINITQLDEFELRFQDDFSG